MRFAIGIPQSFSDGEFDPAAFSAYLTRAEELGYESAWAMDQALGLGSAPFLSPLEVMTFAAACTSRIRLGCAVFVTTLYNPVLLAKSLSTLDQLSRGRLEVGVASGGRTRPYAAFGVDADTYLTRYTEGLALLKALWTQPSVTFDGKFWQLKEASQQPGPFTKPHPPLWLGGSAPAALRRAVRLGDGFFGAGSTPTAAFADQVRTVRSELADRAGFGIAKRVYIAIDEDAGRARQRMNAALEGVYGHVWPDLAAAAITGTTDDCLRGVREVADAGAERILFTALFDVDEHAERIAADIIPRIAGLPPELVRNMSERDQDHRAE